jgi:superfamily II DNA or RNA helicase
LTAGYGLVVADECHHVPAASFEHAVKQIGAKYWLGLTATPYRRDKLDDVVEALGRGRHCLVLTQRTGHLGARARALAERGHDPRPRS